MKIIEQILNQIIVILEKVFQASFEFLDMVSSGVPSRTKGYNAEFVSPGLLLSRWEKGFNLTGRRSLSVKLSYQNALIVGGTGVGKSSILLIPSLMTMQGSFVVHDPSGELYMRSTGYLNEKGYEVKILNFARPEASSGYNPLQRAQFIL
jgi:hypothetical protein